MLLHNNIMIKWHVNNGIVHKQHVELVKTLQKILSVKRGQTIWTGSASIWQRLQKEHFSWHHFLPLIFGCSRMVSRDQQPIRQEPPSLQVFLIHTKTSLKEGPTRAVPIFETCTKMWVTLKGPSSSCCKNSLCSTVPLTHIMFGH